MLRFSISLFLLSILSFNAQSSSILPQTNSSGADGTFSPLSDGSLFANPANNLDTANIYNFTDFTLAAGVTLNITESGPVYIYSQQGISINGAIISNSSDLHLIAQNMQISGTISTSNNLSLFASGNSTTPPDTLNATIISSTSGATLTTGIISSNTISSGNSPIITGGNTLIIGTPGVSGGPVIISPSPVPLPTALWLMITGLLSLGLIKRRNHNPN